MATFLPCSIRDIVLLMQTQLAAFTNVDASRIIIVATTADNTPHFNADSDILIRLMEERAVEGIITGSGRYDARMKREIQLIQRVRVYLDQSGQDFSRITDATLGLIQLEDQVFNAMQEFSPTDEAQNVLSAPLYLNGPTSSQRESRDQNWITSWYTSYVEYERKVALPFPS